MTEQIRSLRTFIGAKDYNTLRAFYLDWGFSEFRTSEKMSLFKMESAAFYLQDYYVKDWVNNTMVFFEVNDLDGYWKLLKSKALDQKYTVVKYVEPKKFEWGSEGFLYDPSGVLWHIGNFNS